MQPVGPYRFTEAFGVCQVGTAWWALDGQDRLVTVAVLEGAAANDPPWRQAFANAANTMAQTPTGPRYVNADLNAAQPWVAYPSEEGLGAQRLFQTLGMDLHPAEAQATVLIPATGAVTEPPRPVSGVPTSGSPAPTSGPPQLPWAMHAATATPQQGTTVPQQAPQSPAPSMVSGPPATDPFAHPARRIQPTPAGGGTARDGATWLTVAALVLGILAAVGGVGLTAGGDDTGAQAPGPVTEFPTTALTQPGLRPWADFAPGSPQERAIAVAGPSLVFIESVFTGYLRDRTTNRPVRTTPIVFSRRCTGFVVDTAGHALTSSSCVKPGEEYARRIALDAVARMMVREGKLTDAQVDGYITTNLERTRFTGVDTGTDPSAQLYAQLGEAKGNVTDSPAIPGQVVAAQTEETGNVALVKLERGNLPVAEIDTRADVTGVGNLLILGFATTDSDFRAATYRPRTLFAKIAGTGRRGDLSMWRIGEDLGNTSYGGIAVDPAGRVVGMLDQDLARPDRANRVVLPASAFSGLLGDAGVQAGPGDSDRLYRSGLDAYFTGRYPSAVDQLGTVARQVPDNQLAGSYRQNADNRRQLEGEPSGRPGWARWLLVGAGSALLVVLVLLVVSRARRRG
ncbi:trypsin-like peptidase domain-containing protein [Micromonospora mirobrigensis]|uniref:Trypsin-like peptidase domain-containing protein n=1 Tax=Micromonospora mirobrigensis TaxID=262898 RepID=A0A1C4U9L3_9ACTN|nr:trypsin-like peptidase domain-containing protein [Micromonospora mirobrigensis]SCE68351.1 Trypsin-like peptidase domain-containing protein [Micromonospora mirobrigensis]